MVMEVGRKRGRSRLGSQRSHGSHRLRTYSFMATLGIIAIIIGGSYFGSQPKVEHIPSDFKFSQEPWMSVVPNGIHYVGYVDFQRVYAASGNATFFGQAGLIDFSQLNYSILPESVLYEVDIQLLDTNTAVTILRLQQDVQNKLGVLFAEATKAPSWDIGSYVVRQLLVRTPDQPKPLFGYLSIASGYVLVSVDQQTGLQQVQTVLGQMTYGTPSFFDNLTVQRAVYAAGFTGEPILGLFVGKFGSQLEGSEMIVKSVTSGSTAPGMILVRRSVLFSDQNTALNQYGEAHRIYRDASSYGILDSWLVITYQYSTAKLRSEITGI
jgi:hypothetical protein